MTEETDAVKLARC